MRTLKLAALALLALAPAAYAQVKISDLPAASALAGTEELPVVQSAATRAATPAQLNTYIRGQSGAWTFVSTQTVPTFQAFSTAPQIELRDSDSVANAQRWHLRTLGNVLDLRACNDAGNSCTTPLAFTRNSNEVVTNITIGDTTGNPSLTIPGSGQWLIGGSSGTTGQVLTSNGPGVAPTWQTAGGGVTLQSGTYSPTCTFGSGMSACTATLGNYIRVGNQVQANFQYNGTGASAVQNATMTAPIASQNTGNVVIGTCTSTGTSGSIGRVTSNGAAGFQLTMNASQTTQIPWSCTVQYTVN